MISVFPSTAYTTKELAGVGYPILDRWCKEATLYATLNGEQFIKLVIPHKARNIKISQLPKDLDIIKIHDMDGNEDYYRVRRPVITLKTTTIYAEHITYDLNNNFIEDIYIVNRNGQGAMDRISQGTQYAHPFILRSDIQKVSNIRLVRVNPIQAMLGTAENTFLKRYGGELKRQGFTLSINQRVGVDRTDTIRSGKNLTGFESDYDFDNVVTRIMPKGPNGVLLPEKYVDSPLINRYPFPFVKDVEYKVEYEGEFEKLSTAEKNRVYSELRALAKADIAAGCDVPKAKYKVNFISLRNTIEYDGYRSLENIGLGDMQPVYEAKYDISIQGRVTHIEWDILNEKYKSIELGNFNKGIVKSSIANQSNLQAKIEEATMNASVALKSADGKATNYYGNSEPSNPKEGDFWYKKNGEEDELWQYQLVNGKLQWVYVTGDRYAKHIEERMTNDFEKVNAELAQQEQEHSQAVSDLLKKAGANRLLAEEAKALTAETASNLNLVKDTVSAHTRTIAEQGQSISQVVQTAQGLVSRVADLTTSNNLVYDPTKYSRYIARNSTSNLTLTHYTAYSAMRIRAAGLSGDTYSGFRLPLRTSSFTNGEKLAFRAVIGIDALPDSSGDIRFEIKSNNNIVAYFYIRPTRTGNNQVFTATTTVLRTVSTVDEYALDILIPRNGNVNITQISIVRGETPPKLFSDSTTTQEIATATQVSQLAGSWAVQNLTSAGTVLNQINLNRNGSVKIDGKLVQITGETIINSGVIKSAMIGNGQIGTAQIGTIDASKANLININATNISTNGLTANVIKGGTLTSLNGSTAFNLQTGWLDMNSESVGIRNLWPNYPIQYLVFGRGSIHGKSASYTALMSNSKRTIGMNDGSAGIQIWNAMDNTTAVNVYGDEVAFMYNAHDKKGIIFNNVTNDIHSVNILNAANVNLASYGGNNLVALFNDIYRNLRLLHNNKTTETNYTYSMYGPL